MTIFPGLRPANFAIGVRPSQLRLATTYYAVEGLLEAAHRLNSEGDEAAHRLNSEGDDDEYMVLPEDAAQEILRSAILVAAAGLNVTVASLFESSTILDEGLQPGFPAVTFAGALESARLLCGQSFEVLDGSIQLANFYSALEQVRSELDIVGGSEIPLVRRDRHLADVVELCHAAMEFGQQVVNEVGNQVNADDPNS
jgi:hypothetical protein